MNISKPHSRRWLLGAGALAALLGGTAVYLRTIWPPWNQPPANNPARCRTLVRSDKRVVAFIGDSITHGRASANYVDMLAQQLNDPSVLLVNAGVNGELAYNACCRLDDVIACAPDVVFILIGTNDANAGVNAENAAMYQRDMQLPQTPDADFFVANLRAMVTQLQADTTARIALLTLPTIGEDPTHPAWQVGARYSELIAQVGAETAVAVLPLHETMAAALAADPPPAPVGYDGWREVMEEMFVRHFFLRQSFDRLAARYGYRFHVDALHLSPAGAQLIVDLVRPFLQQSPP